MEGWLGRANDAERAALQNAQHAAPERLAAGAHVMGFAPGEEVGARACDA